MIVSLLDKHKKPTLNNCRSTAHSSDAAPETRDAHNTKSFCEDAQVLKSYAADPIATAPLQREPRPRPPNVTKRRIYVLNQKSAANAMPPNHKKIRPFVGNVEFSFPNPDFFRGRIRPRQRKIKVPSPGV